MSKDIKINKYVYFSGEFGSFFLTVEAEEIIYHKKRIICSYSGANEWCNHFICELIDLYTGMSKYNYALGCIVHEKEIPIIFKENPDSVIEWVQESLNKEWSQKMYKMFENIIDNLPTN